MKKHEEDKIIDEYVKELMEGTALNEIDFYIMVVSRMDINKHKKLDMRYFWATNQELQKKIRGGKKAWKK